MVRVDTLLHRKVPSAPSSSRLSSWVPSTSVQLMITTRLAIAVTLATLAFAAAPATRQDRKAGGPSRQRPPEAFACEPNDLTAYTGVVVRSQRQRERTTLRIRTDWDTTEEVAVPHHGAADAAASFRYAGRPFTANDWERIESSSGVLRPSTRATAWVCKDGKVLVDWAVPKEG
jgi:hypothetical protein